MKLPKSVSKYISLFSVMLLISILFANPVLFIASLVPLFVLISGFILKVPEDVTIQRKISGARFYTGDTINVSVEVKLRSGIGNFIVSDLIPAQFQLAKGSNFAAVWKGFGTKRFKVNYSVKCSKSGTYAFDIVKWQSSHCLYKQIVSGEYQANMKIEIYPKLLDILKVKNSLTLSNIPMPIGADSKIGIPTLEFKETKLYSSGDSFKNINWKASARNIHHGIYWPVVNEYENEGKRVVWIFMDVSMSMYYGSNVNNVFDYALEAVNGLADYYIKQQCSVAFCTYRGRESFVFPGTGKKQYQKILKELLKLNSHEKRFVTLTLDGHADLEQAVLAHNKYFQGSKPLFVVVTRHSSENPGAIDSGIKVMNKYTKNLPGRPQIMVVNIVGHELAIENESEKLATKLLGVIDENTSFHLRKRCIWIDWNPARSSFSQTLLKRVVRK